MFLDMVTVLSGDRVLWSSPSSLVGRLAISTSSTSCKVSRSFSPSTCHGYEGFHPRHVSLLSDDAITCFAGNGCVVPIVGTILGLALILQELAGEDALVRM